MRQASNRITLSERAAILTGVMASILRAGGYNLSNRRECESVLSRLFDADAVSALLDAAIEGAAS